MQTCRSPSLCSLLCPKCLVPVSSQHILPIPASSQLKVIFCSPSSLRPNPSQSRLKCQLPTEGDLTLSGHPAFPTPSASFGGSLGIFYILAQLSMHILPPSTNRKCSKGFPLGLSAMYPCSPKKMTYNSHFSTYVDLFKACRFSAIGLFTCTTDKLFC